MKRLFAVFLFAFCVCYPSFAQQTTGSLVGTVTDTSGASVSHAAITVTNVATGTVVTAESGAGGEYRVSNLLPGRYTLSVNAQGFAAFKLNNIGVDLNKVATADAKLAVGANTSVEVESEASVALDTTSQNLSQTLSTQELSQLPTATIGLGVLNTSLLSANVATSGGIGAGTGPSVGGQRPRNNNFMIEGIDNNDKGVTGPLIYIPNDAVGEFTLITNQFSPEFGHSSGGQFNTTVLSGTNKFHGTAYEYFDNRNLNAIDASTARSFAGTEKPYNPRYDFNRYGGQIGGPIKHNKLFFFANYERQTTGQTYQGAGCAPIQSGWDMLKALPNVRAENLQVLEQYLPVAPGTTPIDASADAACLNSTSGPQYISAYTGGGTPGSGTREDIPMGNYQISAPLYSNFGALTTSVDWTISEHDSFRARYLYNTDAALDTTASLPSFWQTLPIKNHLVALSEFHTFTPNLINEARLGYSRFYQNYQVGPQQFAGLDSFPNLYLYDIGLDLGPDDNAPQATVQNLYQFTDNVSWTKGKHTLKIGFDGRKYIAPQQFTQRVRGDYEWYNYYNSDWPTAISDYLHDFAPTYFGQRSTGNFSYAGDQTALYGYGNDTWRVSPKLTLNLGLRYEFTAVPVGERQQALNSLASAAGVIDFRKPEPFKKGFAPRFGVNYAPTDKTSIRAGFGLAYDVLYDNQGLLSLPPQFSSTHTVGDPGFPAAGDPNFLANGGLPPGNGSLATFDNVADQRAATAAYVPDQKPPYAETYTLSIQHVFASDYTAEIRYVGTHGVHLPVQEQINKRSLVDSTHNLPTFLTAPSTATLDSLGTQNTLATLEAPGNLVPAFANAGFTSVITAYMPYGGSNYNSLAAQLTKRLHHGLMLNFAYTWSKTMDDSTADVFSTVLTPRRAQDGQNLHADYSRSALDRTNRLSLAALYDLQLSRGHNWFVRNIVGNWQLSPVYTYQSPEYGTVNSATDSNLNGDSAGDRAIVNPNGTKGIGSGVTALYSPALAGLCTPPDTECDANTVAYVANNPNAYYITAGAGAYSTAARNTLPLRPIDDVDLTASKSFTFGEAKTLSFQAQSFNVLNHPQYISGSINTINSIGDTSTSTLNYLTPSTGSFNHPEKVFSSNSRTMQLAVKFAF